MLSGWAPFGSKAGVCRANQQLRTGPNIYSLHSTRPLSVVIRQWGPSRRMLKGRAAAAGSNRRAGKCGRVKARGALRICTVLVCYCTDADNNLYYSFYMFFI